MMNYINRHNSFYSAINHIKQRSFTFRKATALLILIALKKPANSRDEIINSVIVYQFGVT